jgi:hypothetical protein
MFDNLNPFVLHVVLFIVFLFYYRDIILSDNLHHSSFRLLLVKAGSIATAAIPICHESVSTFLNSVYSAYVIKVLEIVSFSLQICATSNKHAIHCMLKFYKQVESMGND